MPGQNRYSRSAHLVSYWQDGSLVLYNYATRTYVLATAEQCAVVDACERPLTLSGIMQRCRYLDPSSARQMIRPLLKAGILYRDGDTRPSEEVAMSRLTPWNPEAGFFHRSTQDVSIGERAEGERQHRARVKGWRMPVPVKRYTKRPTVVLPPPDMAGDFPAVLLGRRTWRRLARDPITSRDLATLLGLCAGIHHWILVKGIGKYALRTSPSGGARHPIEVYVLVLNVRGVRRGLYHYASDRHQLESLRKGAPLGGVDRYLPNQYWFEDAAALVFFSAIVERTMWRYRYSRAYRALLVEAGHLCQTFCLTATWLGLAPFCSMALSDSIVNKDLGLDGISESVLYAAGVGRRLMDGHRAFAPADVRAPRLVPNSVFAKDGR